ncbi:DNRLRE domain-containing protein [Streptomyces sp. LARHCF249]
MSADHRGWWGSGGASRWIASGAALLVAGTLLQGTATAATAGAELGEGQAAQAGIETARAVLATDISRARVAARESGRRVEAVTERSETTTTWANPDGTLTTDVSAGPIRFYDQKARVWRDVDVNLARSADGAIASKAHPHGLKLGSGVARAAKSASKAAASDSSTDLVTLGEGDRQITLQWKGTLPAPTLKGTRAEYTNAVAGGDVVVEATRTGFEQFVELKQRPAADGYSYTLPLTAKGLKVEQQADGSVLFTDRKSHKTSVMPAPVMWDSTVDPVSGEHTRRVRVGMKVVQKKGVVDLVVTPDAKFLADPSTKYPVVVDPSTSMLGNIFDTYVQQGETVDWSNDTELDLGNPGTTNANGTPRLARSFITWNTAPLADLPITYAQLGLWNFHSGNTDCTAQPWEVWSADGPTTASRWTNQPRMAAKYATSTETHGNPGCASNPDGWANADVTSLVQHWASQRWAYSSMGLRASSETPVAQWKRFNSANASANPPKLTVIYNYQPTHANGSKTRQAGPPFSADSTGTWFTPGTTPTLRDTFLDQDGDKVSGTFQIFDTDTNTQVGTDLVSPSVAPGTPAEVTVPAGLLKRGHTYQFRSMPDDGTHSNSGWSPWSRLRVAYLPDTPQNLQAGAVQSTGPILSALITDPAQRRVSAEFRVKDSAGTIVPGLKVAPVWKESGSRAALQLENNALRDGVTYKWQARACSKIGCSPWSADQSLPVSVQQPPAPPATLKKLVIRDAALDTKSAVTACSVASCLLAGDQLIIGKQGNATAATWIKADLSGIPKGARVTSAKFSLNRSDCASGTCTPQKLKLQELASAWNKTGTGQDLLAAADTEAFISDALVSDLDLAPLIQSWLEQGNNHGVAITVPDGAAGAAYWASDVSDLTRRPELIVEYLAPMAPGAVTDLVSTPGDTGLVATWSHPIDFGAATDPSYVVKVEKADGSILAEKETTTLRAVFSAPDRSQSYRVSVTPKNFFGTGPVTRSPLTQGSEVPGGAASYRDYVVEYLKARNKVITGQSPLAGDAIAESPHGQVFSAILNSQGSGLANTREVAKSDGYTYTKSDSELTEVQISPGSTTGQVLVRATVRQNQTVHLDTSGDTSTEDLTDKRFSFTVAAGIATLTAESDDIAASIKLSKTAAAESQLEVASAETLTTTETGPDLSAVALGELSAPSALDAKAANLGSGIDNSAVAQWAWNNADIKADYPQDCANFISKALYHGGGMKMRGGGWYTSDKVWWRNSWSPPLVPKNSRTWSGAENLRRHLGYRSPEVITKGPDIRPGDIIFFKWVGEPVFNHVAVITSVAQPVGKPPSDLYFEVAQHGRKNRTTFADIRHTYDEILHEPIERAIAIRPKARY